MRGNYEDRHPSDFVVDPTHSGKATCHKCHKWIEENEYLGYYDFQHKYEFPKAHFHKRCYNNYEHYYGLDKPID